MTCQGCQLWQESSGVVRLRLWAALQEPRPSLGHMKALRLKMRVATQLAQVQQVGVPEGAV